jgi:predicted transcriptional regulator
MQDIDESIMRYIQSQDWPVTTEMVGKAIKISWNTAQVHLYKLMAEGLVKGKKVGRQNQWMVTEKWHEYMKGQTK